MQQKMQEETRQELKALKKEAAGRVAAFSEQGRELAEDVERLSKVRYIICYNIMVYSCKKSGVCMLYSRNVCYNLYYQYYYLTLPSYLQVYQY